MLKKKVVFRFFSSFLMRKKNVPKMADNGKISIISTYGIHYFLVILKIVILWKFVLCIYQLLCIHILLGMYNIYKEKKINQ